MSSVNYQQLSIYGVMQLLTVCNGLFLWEVVYDGLARGLRVRSRVSMLLELLLCHQVRLQLPVQRDSCRGTEQQVKQMLSLCNNIIKAIIKKFLLVLLVFTVFFPENVIMLHVINTVVVHNRVAYQSSREPDLSTILLKTLVL